MCDIVLSEATFSLFPQHRV